MEKKRLCPVENAGSLDNKFRRWLQNPQKILKPYVKRGMTVLDQGCGPGFFSVEMAQMVGETGRVIASDVQEGMLQKLRSKIKGTELEERIILHKCREDTIGITEKVDFVLAFYMVHEISDQERFFKEIWAILKTNGILLIVEPPFHVSTKSFNRSVEKARDTGLLVCAGPKVFLSKTAILNKH